MDDVKSVKITIVARGHRDPPAPTKFSPIGGECREIYGTVGPGPCGRQLFSKLSASCIALSLQFGRSIFTASLGESRAREIERTPCTFRAPRSVIKASGRRKHKPNRINVASRYVHCEKKHVPNIRAFIIHRYNNPRGTDGDRPRRVKLDLANYTTVINEKDSEILHLAI